MSSFLLNLRAPFCTSTFALHFLKAFLDVHTGVNNTSPLCILCTLMPQIIPLLTFTLVCTWYEESTSRTLSVLMSQGSLSYAKIGDMNVTWTVQGLATSPCCWNLFRFAQELDATIKVKSPSFTPTRVVIVISPFLSRYLMCATSIINESNFW